MFAKGYTVFNIEQVDNCKLPKRFEPKLSHNERIAHADSFFTGVRVQIRDGGNRAYYRPDTPEAVYLPAYDSGDHLHPNDAGYAAMANAIDLALFTP